MNNQDVFSQLHKLKELKPRSEWKERSRDILLAEIKSTSSAQGGSAPKARKAISWRFRINETFSAYIPQPVRLAVKPVLVSIIVLVLILEGGILTVNASKGSLPGDTFYSVKVATEKVQISFATSEEAKAKLEVEFAGRRVEEIVKISKQESSPEKQKQVEVAVTGLKKNINTAKTRLKKLEKQEGAHKAMEVAQVLEKKTHEYEEALTQSIIIEPVREFKITVTEAIDLVEDTGDEAMDVIVEKVVSGEVEVTKEEVAEIVEKKIEKAQSKVDEAQIRLEEVSVKVEEVREANKPEVQEGGGVLIETVDTEVETVADEVESAVSQGAEATKNLEEAAELLTLDDLAGAVSKVKKAKDLTKDTEAVAESQGAAVEILIIEKVESDSPSSAQGGSGSLKRHGPAKPGEQMRSSLDSKKAKRLLSWSPRVRLDEGLGLTVEWFRG